MTSAHSILPLLSTILLLYSTATTAVSGAPIPVLDTDGDPVTGLFTPYYITGALESKGNGLHLIHLEDQCRHNVKLAPPKLGAVLLLFPSEDQPTGDQTVYVNENVLIGAVFDPLPPNCDGFWRLNAKTGLVTAGGLPTEEHNLVFRIVRHEISGGNYYKILSCPDDGSPCLTLGVNEQLLGTSTTPLIVQFQKAAEESAAMHSTA